MDIFKMKKAAEKLIAANGRKETLAALSGFAQVCGPEEVLELIKFHERVAIELNSVHEWCFQALAARDYTARQQAATLRSALVAVFGTDDLIALEVLKANYRHLGATMPLRHSHEKIIAAIDVLIATHPDNNPET